MWVSDYQMHLLRFTLLSLTSFKVTAKLVLVWNALGTDPSQARFFDEIQLFRLLPVYIHHNNKEQYFTFSGTFYSQDFSISHSLHAHHQPIAKHVAGGSRDIHPHRQKARFQF